ncbi:MAG: HNH endonuclease [Gemmatimonadota bacterium]
MPFTLDVLELGRLYTRPELARLWGYQGFEAISRGVVTPADSATIVLFVTREKQQSLTQYRDFISGDRLYWEGQKRHGTDDRIARAHESGEQIHLFYRDVHHTPFRYYGQLLATRFVRKRDKPSEFTFQLVHDLSAEDDVRSHESELAAIEETERREIVRARVGQGRFRADLLRVWGECAVTGVDRADLLRASHIKPWRFSSNRERMDRFNGLLLLPQYDHLFDRGYITFHDDGRLEPSPAITSVPADRLGVELRSRLRRVEDRHLPFLEYHREQVFVARRG